MKYIEKLTKEQEAMMPVWRDKWIEIGLQTGETDWATAEEQIKLAYAKANIPFPNKPVIHVQSPLVGAFASSIADKILKSKGKKSGAVEGAVGVAVEGAVRGAVEDAVEVAVRGAVGDAVRGAVEDAVEVAVRGAVEDAVRGAVGDAVEGAVEDAVGDAVEGAVEDAVGGAVGGAVRVAVEGAVGDAVEDAKLNWHYWLGGQFWVGWYWGSPSYVSFFTEVCGLELDKDIQERATIYDKLCRSVNFIWPNSEFVMMCARPIRICREDGRLHSDQVKAIEYPDGWGLYALDGVILKEDLWKSILSGKMTFAEIMAIEISDQRTVALKYNPQAILNEGSELVHKDNRNNELYKIEGRQINKDLGFDKIWFLKMLCPTGRVFIEGVPPEEAEKNPNATYLQALLCGLTLDEYMTMELES